MNKVDAQTILSPYFTANKYFDDMVPDFMTMVVERLVTFDESIDETYKEQLKSEIMRMTIHSRKPVLDNRVYIISNMENILFATCLLSDKEIHMLKDKLRISGTQVHLPDFLKLPSSVVITLYVFHKNENPYRLNILPTELTYILDKYKKQNYIIDYGI